MFIEFLFRPETLFLNTDVEGIQMDGVAWIMFVVCMSGTLRNMFVFEENTRYLETN